MNSKIVIDLSRWTRLPELIAFAQQHNVGIEDAIAALVNSGLSHQ